MSAAVAILLLGLAVGLLLALCLGLALDRRRQSRARQVEQARAALVVALVDQADLGMALYDGEGRLLVWNRPLETLLARTFREGEAAEGAIARAEPFEFECDGVAGIRLAAHGRPLGNGHYLLTYADLAEQRAHARRLADLVSSVSHELRTPVTSIRGAIGLLSGPMSAQMPPRAVDLLRLADRNAARLLTLVNDLLDVEKMEMGQIDFLMAPVDLNTIALEACEMNRAYAAQRGVTLALGGQGGPVFVEADASRLQQVMANLISNAAKFSPEGGVVTVTVEVTRGQAIVIVHDAGEGIPEQFRARIFEKFAQASNGTQRQTGGSGLGLSISKAIVERHGGTIDFTSEPGSTSFRFVLPVAGVAALAA